MSHCSHREEALARKGQKHIDWLESNHWRTFYDKKKFFLKQKNVSLMTFQRWNLFLSDKATNALAVSLSKQDSSTTPASSQ